RPTRPSTPPSGPAATASAPTRRRGSARRAGTRAWRPPSRGRWPRTRPSPRARPASFPAPWLRYARGLRFPRRTPNLQPARSLPAARGAAALPLGLGGPAGAAVLQDEGLEAAQKDTPVLLDAFILRPVGLVLTAVGTVLFVPAAAVVGATRPTDIGKPF